MGYDAFLSYSHANDGKLAPAVQSGLQRLARPWYRSRALHIFRDETGLTVNPHLWASIQEALDDSSWFVLLCSPDAAASPWVDREVQHWLSTRPADRILPVLTAGTMLWDDAVGDFTPDSHVPPALHGAFVAEPRFLDLRWAHDEEDLDLRHSRFRGAIAALAAPMHNTTTDALEGEDIRQYRRARRWAKAAIALLLFLTAAALLTGALAVNQATRARAAEADAQAEAEHARALEITAERSEAQALIAERLARADSERAQAAEADAAEQLARAQSAEADANESAMLADQEAANAQSQAQRADSEAVAARAQTARADRAAQDARTQAARADAAAENARQEADNANQANAAAAGSAQLANENSARADTEAQRATTEAQRATSEAERANTEAAEAKKQRDLAQARAIAANGLTRALTVDDMDTGLLLTAEASLRSDDFQVRDAFLRALQQRPETLVRFVAHQPAGVAHLVPSPDGTLAVTTGEHPFLVRVADGANVPIDTTEFAQSTEFSADGSRLALATDTRILVVDTATGQTTAVVPDLQFAAIALDRHGQRLAAGTAASTVVFDLTTMTATPLAMPAGVTPSALAISPDGSRVAVVAPTPPPDPETQGPGPFDVYQFDAATGALVAPVQSAHFGPCACLFGREGRLRYVDTPGGLTLESFVTLSETDALVVWDATTMTKLLTVPSPASPPEQPENIADVSADHSRVLTVGVFDGTAHVRDAATGNEVGAPLPANLQHAFAISGSPGGILEARFLDAAGTSVLTVGTDGKLRLWDLAHPVAPASRNVVLDAPDPDGFGKWFTRSGSVVAVETLAGDAVKLFDGNDGHLIRVLPHPVGGFPAATFSRDETRFIMTSGDIFETAENETALRIWDVATGALLVEQLLDAATATPVISADGTRVAIPMFGPGGQFVQVRDAATGALVAQYGDSDHEVFLTGLAPDGRTLVFFDDAVDILTGAHVPIPRIFQATTEPLFFSADGRRAATITLDHVTVFDVATTSVIRTIAFPAQTFAGFLALSPDGSTLAVSNLDGTTALYDVATGFQFGELIDQFAGEFLTDGSLLALTAGPQGILVHRFDTTTAAFRLHTCALASRSLNADEWSRYIGDGTAPRAAC